MAKDYLFKTIEFSKVNRETQYMVTRIKPIFSSEVYLNYPNEKFEYTSIQKMYKHLQELLGYTQKEIDLLPLEQVTSYYEPLYTIKWYIGGLYDYMRTNQYKNTEEKYELFEPLIDDSKIDTAQNELLGFTFPERMMKLIRNKPVNRMRMYIKAAPENTKTVSELVNYNYFKWITTNQFTPDGSGKTAGIKIAGASDDINLNTYQWVVFGETDNDTELTTQFNPARHKYIGISCNNISEIVQTTKEGAEWPYSWSKLPTSETDNNDTSSYVSLGTYTYYCYIRYSNNKTKLNKNSYDSRGYMYMFIGIFLTFDNTDTATINDVSNYKWYKLTTFNNIIKYDFNKKKRYYLYVRFVGADNKLSDIVIPGNTKDIKISFFNETDNKENNPIYDDISQYEGTITYNIYNTYAYNHLGETKYAWVKFADTLTANGSQMYDYGIYTEDDQIKIRKYLYISYNHNADENVLLDHTKYYKIQLDTLTNEDSYSATVLNENGEPASNGIYIKFSNSVLPPTIIGDTCNAYSLENTNYLLISITDKNGVLHNDNNSQNAVFNDFAIIVSIRQSDIPTRFEKNRYAYFTYTDEIADPKLRSQYPMTVVDGENRNKKYFGYSYVNSKPLSNKPQEINEPDKASREITLYRGSKINGLTEENITKITSINIPYTSMGSFAVFNFDPIVLNDNEYLIIGGNRDNTCALTCINSLLSGVSSYADYTQKNTDNKLAIQERPQFNGTQPMYYTQVNFINNDIEWNAVYDRYLPIDIGCGFAASSNEVQVTTKSFKEILEETRINDQAALKAYQAAQQNSDGHYKSPNYDLYINLTYKFAKIIDGNVDYMPLYNRYKITYKFKNEEQRILQQKVFDTSVITPDGSVYNKPNSIEINGITYEKLSEGYINYFDYIEGEFTNSLQETDKEVTDNDYDVAYFQCDNILEKIYQTDYDNPNSQQFDKNYYNYKWLADNNNEVNERLPVLCEVTISAIDTATSLYTRIIPVSLAAYSLVEVTDDYIKTTVSKIENDYIYGLTQRTSRIEQYADRISMSVQNIGQGLYSRMQMTEDRILMEVVDASKQMGSAINMYSDKIQQMVYDVSTNMYSQILLEKQKISLEVSNNFRKAGIYLTDNSATIDADNIILRGDRTTIYNTLTIKQGEAEGIVMLDTSKADRIHITVDDIPERDQLAAKGTSQYIRYPSNKTAIAAPNNVTSTIINRLITDTSVANVAGRHAKVQQIDINLYIDVSLPSLKLTQLDLGSVVDMSKLNATITVIEGKLTAVEKNNGSRQLSSENIYGAAGPNVVFQWVYQNRVLSKTTSEKITIYKNFSNTEYPVLTFQGMNYEDISITSSNDTVITNFTKTKKDDSHVSLSFTLGEAGESKIEASYSFTKNNTTYSDTCSYIINVAEYSSSFGWYKKNSSNNDEPCEICTIYYDDIQNSRLPYLVITGDGIRMADIAVTFNFNGLNPFIKTGNNGTLEFTSNTPGTIPQDENTDVIITATYKVQGTDTTKTQKVTIKIASAGGGTNLQDYILQNTEYTYPIDTSQYFNIALQRNGKFNTEDNNIDLYFENIETSKILFGIESNMTELKFYNTSYTQTGRRAYANAKGNLADYNYNVYPGDPRDMKFYVRANKVLMCFRVLTNGPFNTLNLGIEHEQFIKGIKKISFVKSADINKIDIKQARCVYDIENISDNVFVNADNNNQQHVIFLDSNLGNIINIDLSYIYLIFEISSDYNYDFINFDYIALDYLSSTDDANYLKFLITTQWKKLSSTGKLLSPTYTDMAIRSRVEIQLNFSYTKGTRIGKNGIYSFVSDETLFYMTDDLIEQRMENNGIRIAKWVSDTYAGSSALEVYYGGENEENPEYWWGWSNTNKWVSLFNYKPLIRFYGVLNSITGSITFNTPAQHKKLNTITGKWEGGETSWRKESRFGLLAEDESGPYYWWDYDISFHRGDISIEQVPNYETTHIITLPVSTDSPTFPQTSNHADHTYYGGWYAVEKDSKNNKYQAKWQPRIPVGFTITIMNSQYFTKDLKMANSDNKFSVGVEKARIVITTITNNPNFIYREYNNGQCVNWGKSMWNYGKKDHRKYCNFLDAHGDYCSYIEMTKLDRQYLTDIYHDNSVATFVWNGFIWKTSIDVDSNGQLDVANNA